MAPQADETLERVGRPALRFIRRAAPPRAPLERDSRRTMVIYSLYIINKAGGVIYQQVRSTKDAASA